MGQRSSTQLFLQSETSHSGLNGLGNDHFLNSVAGSCINIGVPLCCDPVVFLSSSSPGVQIPSNLRLLPLLSISASRFWGLLHVVAEASAYYVLFLKMFLRVSSCSQQSLEE